MDLKDSLVTHLSAETAGFICVENDGGYVATFSISYILNGQEFHQDSGDYAKNQRRCLDIPAGATDINLVIKIAVFIKTWSTIFKAIFPTPVEKCYKLTGTTLKPHCQEVSCK